MSDDLVKQLQDWRRAMYNTGWVHLADSMEAVANRIEELEAKLATCEKYKAAYAECDRIGTQAVRELESENKRLNEQMDVIEEMGTESLNALPDCLMRLAPALVENDELKAKLAKAVEALFEAIYLLDPDEEDMAKKVGVYRIVTTFKELKGETDE